MGRYLEHRFNNKDFSDRAEADVDRVDGNSIRVGDGGVFYALRIN